MRTNNECRSNGDLSSIARHLRHNIQTLHSQTSCVYINIGYLDRDPAAQRLDTNKRSFRKKTHLDEASRYVKATYTTERAHAAAIQTLTSTVDDVPQSMGYFWAKDYQDKGYSFGWGGKAKKIHHV